jgi:hypothetical protein
MLAWITAALTFALMAITAFYAWSNYRVMRIMEGDFRARTQPIPKLGVNLDSSVQAGSKEGYMGVLLRTENAPVRLLELSIHVTFLDGRITHTDCLIGDPRVISPLTSAEFTPAFDPSGFAQEWTALIIYTDLGETMEFHTKLHRDGFSLTTMERVPGFFQKLVTMAKDQMYEMDLE